MRAEAGANGTWWRPPGPLGWAGYPARKSLAVPADAEAGSYSLSVVVYDGPTQAAFADQYGESPTTLSSIEVGLPGDE